jgi:hypothetical protein
MPAWDWQIVGNATADQLLPYCDATTPILHTDTDRVSPTDLENLPRPQWQSLQLVRATKIEFARDPRSRQRWRAGFHDAAGHHYSLMLTDIRISGRLDRGEKIAPDCLLTVSLTAPWAPVDGSKPPMCYKLVAAVIEL